MTMTDTSPTTRGLANPFALLQLALLAWFTVWLGMVVLNNITDFGTNETYIRQMYQMQPLMTDPVIGNGLQWRAFPGWLAGPTLVGVIAYQLTTVGLLASAVPAGFRHWRGAPAQPFVDRANRALTAALGLFGVFLVGGMFFGYWMFMGPFQAVHFTMLTLVVLSAVLVNMPGRRA